MPILLRRITFALLTIAAAMPAHAVKGTVGGLNALGSCIQACAEPPESEAKCRSYCECTLEFDTQNPNKWKGGERIAEAAGAFSYQALVCRAQVWPDRFKAPPSIEQIQEADAKAQAAAKLSDQKIDFVGFGMVARELEPLVRQAMKDGQASGTPNRIACSYGPFLSDTGKSVMQVTYFWYRKLPDNFDEWKARDTKMSLLRLGGVAVIDKCPERLGDAEKILAEGRQKYRAQRP